MEDWMKKLSKEELMRVLQLRFKIEQQQEDDAEKEGDSIRKASIYAPVRRKSNITHLHGAQKRVRAKGSDQPS